MPLPPIGKRVRRRVERMLRRYPIWCARRDRLEGALHESHPSVVILAAARGACASRPERDAAIAVELQELDAQIRDCDACLAALTRREAEFVRAYYWECQDLVDVARAWGVSRWSLRRLRHGIIAKCVEVLGLCERETWSGYTKV